GLPFVYQGEGLGLGNGSVAPEHIKYPVGLAAYEESRDFCRTPMRWDSGPNNGFTTGEPWLVSSPRRPEETVEFQRQDPDSFLHRFRRLLLTRRRLESRRSGKVEWLPSPPGVALALYGEVLVVYNLNDDTVRVELPPGDWRLEYSPDGSEGEVTRSVGEVPPEWGGIYSRGEACGRREPTRICRAASTRPAPTATAPFQPSTQSQPSQASAEKRLGPRNPITAAITARVATYSQPSSGRWNTKNPAKRCTVQ